MGVGFTLVLTLLGILREIIGQGTLFSGMDLLFGPVAENWTIIIIPDYQQFLFAVLPPGAFVALGLIIAVKNLIDEAVKNRQKEKAVDSKTSRRVRVTGTIQ